MVEEADSSLQLECCVVYLITRGVESLKSRSVGSARPARLYGNVHMYVQRSALWLIATGEDNRLCQMGQSTLAPRCYGNYNRTDK